MPKVTIGGKRRSIPSFSMNNNTKLPRASVQVQAPSQKQIDNGNTTPKGGVAFSKFQAMSDDDKADVIEEALKVGTPFFLDRSGLQRFAYYTGMNEKPDVLTDGQWSKLKGTKLYRSVHDAYNSGTDISYTKSDIAKQVMEGDFTNYSDSGGSAYGKALYFDVKKGSYGSGNRYAIIRAKIKSSANIGDYDAVSARMLAERSHGTKLAKAIAKADSQSQISLYAVAKGYDGLKDAWSGYHMIFNRKALAISKKLG